MSSSIHLGDSRLHRSYICASPPLFRTFMAASVGTLARYAQNCRPHGVHEVDGRVGRSEAPWAGSESAMGKAPVVWSMGRSFPVMHGPKPRRPSRKPLPIQRLALRIPCPMHAQSCP